MNDEEITIEEAIKWTQEKLKEEEKKAESTAIEPIQYKPPGVTYIVDGEEVHSHTKEQMDRRDAIMKPLKDIHFSWTPAEMKNIVKNGLEERQKVYDNIGIKDNKGIENIKWQLSSLIRKTIELGNNITAGTCLDEDKKWFNDNVAKIKELRKSLNEATSTEMYRIQEKMQAEFTEKHEESEFLDEQMPKMLEAKKKYDHGIDWTKEERTEGLKAVTDNEDWIKNK